MKKQVKKSGSSLIIRFNIDEIQWYNLQPGDWIDIGDIVKIKTQKGGKLK